MSGMTQELLISENNETGYRDQFQIVVRKIGPEKTRLGHDRIIYRSERTKRSRRYEETNLGDGGRVIIVLSLRAQNMLICYKGDWSRDPEKKFQNNEELLSYFKFSSEVQAHSTTRNLLVTYATSF